MKLFHFILFQDTIGDTLSDYYFYNTELTYISYIIIIPPLHNNVF